MSYGGLTAGYNCQRCGQFVGWNQGHACGIPSQTPAKFGPFMGCICPPVANKECENPMCPRKNRLSATGATP